MLEKGKINQKIVINSILVIIMSFFTSYLAARLVLHLENYIQVSLDVFLHLTILLVLYFMVKKHGLWVLPFVAVSFLIVAFSEIQSVYFLKTYKYIGFPRAVFFEYPTTIALAWVYWSYGSYLLTNILVLNRESSKGFTGSKYRIDKPLYYSIGLIILLAVVDGLFLSIFGILNETAGIDLNLWTYVETSEPKFYGAPTRTLYTYFYASFVINLAFRLIELIKAKYQADETLSFKNSDLYILVLIPVYLFFFILESVIKYNIDHWSIFVSVPVLLLIIITTLNKFYYSPSNTSSPTVGNR